jgi:fatty-acyl-CoA synthase
VLVSAPEFRTSDYRAMVAEVHDECPDLREVLFLGDPAWEQLLATGRSADAGLLARREAQLSADDPINIQYTSGTTGFPKGATLTHHNLLNNGFFVGEGCGYTEADRICIPVPYYHCFGMGMGNLAATSHGATMIIPAPGFDPALTLQAVQEERCASLYGVPTMFIAELALPDFAGYDLSSLRTGIMAGSPCPVEVMKRVVSEMGMTEVTICYGMTETSPVSTLTGADDDLERYGEELMAWVRLREGAEPLTAEALRSFCAGRLAHYKVPRYVKVVDEFPMTVTGKIRKVEMRQASVEELGLQSAAAVRNA